MLLSNARGIRQVLVRLLCSLALCGFAVPAGAQQVVALSGDGTMRMLADPGCTGTSCPWALIDSNRRSVAVAATRESLFQLHDNGAIWLWRGQPCEGTSCPHWTRVDNNAGTRAIAANRSHLFQLHENGEIWRWLGRACEGNRCPSWERLDRNPRTVAIAAAGSKLFQLHSNGEIWQWKGQPCAGERCASWERLDRNPDTRQIVAAAPGNLYQRHENGSIWRWDERPCQGDRCLSWSRLDNNPRTQSIVAAPGALYQVHNNGATWRWLGRACESNRCPHWEQLSDDRSTRAIVAGEAPYVGDLSTRRPGPAPVFQVRGDGSVLRWTGTPCSGATCPAWNEVGGGGFTDYRTGRGGLYLFAGNPSFASAPPASAATAEAFGYNTMRFARVADTRVQMNVLLLLTTYTDTEFEDGQTQEFYEEKYFGARQSLENYFNKNSRDLSFDLNHVGTIRIEDDRTLPCAHRWSSCPTPTDGQPFMIATVEQLEGLPASSVSGLARYDRNGDDRLTSEELFILKVEGAPDKSDAYPFDDNGGLRRGLPRCAVLRDTGKSICGTFLPIADETNFATTAHEFAHLFGAADLYGASGGNSYQYTLMGATITDSEMFFHLDPWHKMRMGMVRPRIMPIPSTTSARQSLRLTLPVNNAAYEPVLFYDPARGTDEFFLLEFRRTGASSFDATVPSNGLVIWYVKTDASNNLVNLQTINGSFPEGNAVAIIGAPDQQIAGGRAWQSRDGEIALRWPSGGDSGLRLRVAPFAPGAMFLDVGWSRP